MNSQRIKRLGETHVCFLVIFVPNAMKGRVFLFSLYERFAPIVLCNVCLLILRKKRKENKIENVLKSLSLVINLGIPASGSGYYLGEKSDKLISVLLCQCFTSVSQLNWVQW